MCDKITIAELEDKVWTLEGVRVVVRAPQSDLVDDYNYKRKISATSSISDWGNGRLKPLLDGRDFYVIDGSGTRPHGRTNMETVRESYK